MSAPLLQLDKVEVTYHRVITAVQGISLAVPAGAIVALLGTNGAGKTTTLRAISGFIGLDDARISDGAITFRGGRIDNRDPQQTTALGIALVPERSKVFENLTVEENLAAVVPRRGASRSLADAAWEYFPALARLRRREAGYLSGGERQMLAIGAALMGDPKLLLIDELSLGLAPLVVQEIFRSIRAANAAGTSILLVEQNARYALETASRGYVLQTGSIIAAGPCAELKQDERVKEAYLGRK